MMMNISVSKTILFHKKKISIKYITVSFINILCLFPLSEMHASTDRSKDLYMQTCYVCHGEDGGSVMPGVPDLHDNMRLFIDSEKDIVTRLKTGMQSEGNINMPPYGGNPELSDKQLLLLLRYVKTLVKN